MDPYVKFIRYDIRYAIREDTRPYRYIGILWIISRSFSRILQVYTKIAKKKIIRFCSNFPKTKKWCSPGGGPAPAPARTYIGVELPRTPHPIALRCIPDLSGRYLLLYVARC